MMLHGLDYLYQVCHTVHTGICAWKLDQLILMTDLKPDNIMTRLENKSIQGWDAHDEFNNPLPQNNCADRMIYLSQNNYGSPISVRDNIIVDFGLSDGPHNDCIQAEPFRTPEVTPRR